MKISSKQTSLSGRSPAARRGERGFLVIALMAILAIMLLYINFNLRMLGNLRRELKLVEQHQIQRLEKAGAEPLPLTDTRTNTNAQVVSPPVGQ